MRSRTTTLLMQPNLLLLFSLLSLLLLLSMLSNNATEATLSRIDKITKSSQDHLLIISSLDDFEQFVVQRGDEYSVLMLGSVAKDFAQQCPYCPWFRNVFGALGNILHREDLQKGKGDNNNPRRLVLAMFELSNSNRDVGIRMGLRTIPSISLYKAGEDQRIEMDLQSMEVTDFLKMHTKLTIGREQLEREILKNNPKMAQQMRAAEHEKDDHDADVELAKDGNALLRLVNSNLLQIILILSLLVGVYAILIAFLPKNTANTLFLFFGCCLVMIFSIGGLVHNQINEPPSVQYNPYTKQTVIFMQQLNRQLGLEGYIASGTMIAFALSLLTITEVVSRLPHSSPMKRVLGYVCMWFCIFNLLALIFFFMLKMPSYMHGTTIYSSILHPLFATIMTILNIGAGQ